MMIDTVEQIADVLIHQSIQDSQINSERGPSQLFRHDRQSHVRTRSARARRQPTDLNSDLSRFPLGLSLRKVCLRHDLFDIYFTAKTDMEPRQGGRFHIWHMLGRGRCLFATYALRKTVLSSARTARLNGLRGFGASTSRPRCLRRRKPSLGRS